MLSKSMLNEVMLSEIKPSELVFPYVIELLESAVVFIDFIPSLF